MLTETLLIHYNHIPSSVYFPKSLLNTHPSLDAGISQQINSHRRKYFQVISGYLTDATGSLNSVSGRIPELVVFQDGFPELVMFSEKQAEMSNFIIKNVAKKLLRPSETYTESIGLIFKENY
jgi:hypothetical protein